MGAKCFFWHGIRLLGTLMSWKPIPTPGSPTDKQGTSRLMGRLHHRSRNYLWTIQTKTHIDPQTAIEREDCLDAGRQLRFNLKILQFFATMLQHAKELGDLAWCEDDAEVITPSAVTNPGAYPGALVVTYTGTPAFEPIVGCYILARDPASGDGWVRRVTAVGTGTFTLESAPSEVDTDWRFVLVRFHFPDTMFMQPDGWETMTQADDCASLDFGLTFKSQASAAVTATEYIQDLG